MGKAQSGFTPGVATGSTPSQGTGSHSPAVDPAKRVITQDTHPGVQVPIGKAPTNSVKVITAADGYDHSGRVVDAHLNSRSHGDGLDEQARAEIAVLPRYGEPGWGEAKRKLTQIRAAAARRAAATQQATPGRSDRDAVAGFEGVETGTWDQVRAAAGNQLLYERNRAMARRYGQR
jgi:hypothetical protein